jgi:hypothetical protein
MVGLFLFANIFVSFRFVSFRFGNYANSATALIQGSSNSNRDPKIRA